ncbi:MAG: ABC transporter permease [Myxococcales bacterium]|nr:ABC transporter permease [Myxococcales bacterium]
MTRTLALGCVALFAVTAVVGPWVAPFDPRSIDLSHEFEGPSLTHWLGTAENGVDILSVLLHGARLAGTVGLLVVGLSVILGALIGAHAGYRGGLHDQVITGLADLVQAVPAIVLNITILALVARPGVEHLVFALVFPGWVLYARLARAQTFVLREQEFVEAARALGASDGRIVLRHILPNLAGPMLVQATTGFGAVILAEAALSFLGIGPGTGTSWGALLDQGAHVLLRFPHVALLSGAAIFFTVLGFNLAGDHLRDLLDPRTARRRRRLPNRHA